MSLNVLFIGDIYGKTGRRAVKHFLPILKKEHSIDFVIANGENVTHGKGLSKDHYEELRKIGIDLFTMGNHYLDNKDILKWVDKERVIRPANILDVSNGKKTFVFETLKGSVRVSNLLGRNFIKKHKKENPFDSLGEIINKSGEKIHIVDFHAETTSEKKALAYYFSNKLSAVVGTHTHIQTADERIIDGRCGYITDVGFCGAYESVLGVNIKGAINFIKEGTFTNVSPAVSNHLEFNGVLLKFDLNDGRCLEIIRVLKNEVVE